MRVPLILLGSITSEVIAGMKSLSSSVNTEDTGTSSTCARTLTDPTDVRQSTMYEHTLRPCLAGVGSLKRKYAEHLLQYFEQGGRRITYIQCGTRVWTPDNQIRYHAFRHVFNVRQDPVVEARILSFVDCNDRSKRPNSSTSRLTLE